jgi:hypothetical protein
LVPWAFAAGLVVRRATYSAWRSARESVQTPSAWTTALLAGGLALVLTLLLFFVEPPPVSVDKRQDAFASSTSETPDLLLEVRELPLPFGWDERSRMTLVSAPLRTSPLRPGVGLSFADLWTTTTRHPESAVADVGVGTPRLDLPPHDESLVAVVSSEVPETDRRARPERALAVSVERTMPAAGAAAPLEYMLVVQNVAEEPIEHVSVRESVSDLGQIAGATPPAAVTTDGRLAWELQGLGPGERRAIIVTLLPDGTTPVESVSRVEVVSSLSAATTVMPAAASDPLIGQVPAEEGLQFAQAPELDVPVAQPPPAESPFADAPFADSAAEAFPRGADEPETIVPLFSDEAPRAQPAPLARPLPLTEQRPEPHAVLRIAARAPERAVPGEIVTTVYEISNSGDAPASDVVLTVRLTPELEHRVGSEVEHRIPILAPGELRRARLITRAAASGMATLDATLASGNQPADARESHIHIQPNPVGRGTNTRTVPGGLRPGRPASIPGSQARPPEDSSAAESRTPPKDLRSLPRSSIPESGSLPPADQPTGTSTVPRNFRAAPGSSIPDSSSLPPTGRQATGTSTVPGDFRPTRQPSALERDTER